MLVPTSRHARALRAGSHATLVVLAPTHFGQLAAVAMVAVAVVVVRVVVMMMMPNSGQACQRGTVTSKPTMLMLALPSAPPRCCRTPCTLCHRPTPLAWHACVWTIQPPARQTDYTVCAPAHGAA